MTRPTDNGDYYSPANRRTRHRSEFAKRIIERTLHLVMFGLLFALTLPLFRADLSRGWLWEAGVLVGALLLVPTLLAACDIYKWVRNLTESRVFCRRYESAFQSRPTIKVNGTRIDALCVRFCIYVIVTPLLPAALLVVFSYCGLIQLSVAQSCALAEIYSFALGIQWVAGMPMIGLHAWLKPFERVRSADVH